MYGPNHPERIKLDNQIRDWNSNRLDLFEISEPNEYLEFYGVMRFFYQGEDLKYQTKCLRVSSTATTLDLIDAVVIKFHPDLKMLSNDRYALYESHNMQDRKMKDNEHPLIVQLNWAYDDKDGKFILKNESRRRRSTDLTGHAMLNNYGMSKSTSALGNPYDSQTLRSQSSAVYSTSSSNFFSKRMLSSKKSKRRSRSGKDSIQDAEEAKRMAAELSGKPPESSFTRTISNPDEVMKRRRQRKLESRLEQFSGDNETGGTLKIYGDSINPDIPYKTLLLSVNDTAEKVLSETLDKYGLSQEDHRFYLLVQQNIPPKTERYRGEMPEEIILHDQDCPLGILVHCPPKRGNATFAVRRRTPMDKYPNKPRMPPFSISGDTLPKSPRSPKTKTRETEMFKSPEPPSLSTNQFDNVADYPRLVKLSIDEDGNLYDEDESFSLISLVTNDSTDASPVEGSKFIKIGSQPSAVGNYPNILLPKDYYPDIRPNHCHISAKFDSHNDTIKFTLTPTLDSSSRTPKPCMVYINQLKIEKPTKLLDEDIIQIGETVLFKFEDPETKSRNTDNKSNAFSNHPALENRNESLQNNYFTADLPITVIHQYNLSEQIADRIIALSTNYAEEGTKDLFSSNMESRFHNVDELFQLGPAYTFYLLLRSGLGKEKHVSNLANFIAQNIEQVIQEDKRSVEKEVFWLSNASELLHLLQCDNDLRNYSSSAQEILASAIEQAFSILQSQFSQDLMILLPAFIDKDDSDMQDDTREDISPCLDRASVLITYGDIDYPIQHLLQTLSLAYNLFHNCQVNVALTIQMFSQLFHLLNTWLFNSVLGDSSNVTSNVINQLTVSPKWGARLTRRLNRIKDWSEINGLDMAANCHLQKMYQVAELMGADKRDLNVFGEKCLELININGTQLHFLLENCEDVELPNAWIEVVVNTAIQLHDQEFNGGVPQNKSNLPLLEDLDLRLPLLLPADGYCCDRGIISCPKNLKNMLNALNDIVFFKLNPPSTNQIDTRWKTYLGPYENTPSVSRSGTMIEQSPSAQLRITTQPGLPRNIIGDERSSVVLSSPDSQVDSGDRKYHESRLSNHSSKRPTELHLGNHRSHSPDYSDESNEGEIFKGDLKNRYKVKLKKINNSLGLSIIAARKSQNDIFRIYIKDVIPGGAGHKFGKIDSGDQLVSVDGQLLENINQNEAVEFMKKTKSTVNLLMEKGAAQRHGVLDIILKSKSLKAASQSNPKNVPNLSAEPVKGVKYKQPHHQIHHHSQHKTPTNKSNSYSQISQRTVSRESIPLKISPVVENEHRKRTDYKLPPVPQYSKAPPRPARAPPANRNKDHMNDVVLSDQEYHSYPVRKHRSNQIQNPQTSIYATVSKGKSPRIKDDPTYHSLQNVNNKLNNNKSSSQPNLAMNIPRKRLDTPVSSSSCSSESIRTSDEEDSLPKKIPINKPANQNKKNPSQYIKCPQPPPPPPPIPLPLKQKANHQVPSTRAMSDNNLQMTGKGIPRHEVTSSENLTNPRGSKNRFLLRPTIAQNSEPIMSNNLQSNTENLKTPVKVSHRNHRSQSSTSESESETLSSITQSLSSDQSPKPQQKMNSEPIISFKPNEPEHNKTGIVNQNAHRISEHPTKPNINYRHEDPPIPVPVKKIEPIQPVQPKVDINIPKVNQERTIKSIPSTTKHLNLNIYPPPIPTASHPQYHPPTVLEECDWSIESNKQPVKPPSEEEIKMRRKAIEDKIRHETDIRNKKDEDISSPPESLSLRTFSSEISNNSTNANRNSARYGRPQFHDHSKGNRPESLFVQSTDKAPNNITFPLPPPSLLEKGIIVPASATVKPQDIRPHEIYIDTFKKSQDDNRNSAPESAETLSFKEKMQLFAQKNGENEVIIRNRFSSKQRKIESGNFN